MTVRDNSSSSWIVVDEVTDSSMVLRANSGWMKARMSDHSCAVVTWPAFWVGSGNFSPHNARTAGRHRLTLAAEEWALTMVLMERVTVNVCGDEVPEMAVTRICSPSMSMSNGKSAGLVAVVVQIGPVAVATERLVAVVVAELF